MGYEWEPGRSHHHNTLHDTNPGIAHSRRRSSGSRSIHTRPGRLCDRGSESKFSQRMRLRCLDRYFLVHCRSCTPTLSKQIRGTYSLEHHLAPEHRTNSVLGKSHFHCICRKSNDGTPCLPACCLRST
jgi:hypothetical protein